MSSRGAEPAPRVNLALSDELLLHLVTPDRRAAAQHCAALVGSGLALDHLVDQGLAPAMAEVGTLWESAVWSVADEHAATAVAEAALSAAAAECPMSPHSGEVVVACTEGDWHSLPSRMLAEVLVSRGWSVRFLGASHPTDLLVEHVARHQPQAVLLSCAVPMALPALVDAVQAIHDLGLPVYVGGRALGHSARRAETVGADGWARSASEAHGLLTRPTVPRHRSGSNISRRLEQYRTRQTLMPPWTAQAMKALEAAMPAVASYPQRVRDRTSADLLHLLDMSSIAVLVADPTLMDEQCAWLAHVLAARGVPPDALAYGLRALRQTRPPGGGSAEIDAVIRQAQQSLPTQHTLQHQPRARSEPPGLM